MVTEWRHVDTPTCAVSYTTQAYSSLFLLFEFDESTFLVILCFFNPKLKKNIYNRHNLWFYLCICIDALNKRRFRKRIDFKDYVSSRRLNVKTPPNDCYAKANKSANAIDVIYVLVPIFANMLINCYVFVCTWCVYCWIFHLHFHELIL